MSGIVTLRDWRRLARRRLPRFVFDYLDGGADDESGLSRNVAALRRTMLIPERLNDVSKVSLETQILGVSVLSPMVVAPTGLNGLFWPGGDMALARAAARARVPFVLSTASTSSIEQVAAASTGEKWFQLYVFGARRVSEQLMSRARAAGYSVLVLTVDVPVNGNRERDLRNGFVLPLVPHRRLILDAFRRPRWLARMIRSGIPTLANFKDIGPAIESDSDLTAALLSRTLDRSLTWKSIEWLRAHWQGPIILKGILSPEDALRARNCGVSGIVVSNHGARQLAALPAPMDVLPAIVDAVGADFPVLVDGGFRRGPDIIKAIASGAHAVMIGRPVLYGLGAKGEEGAHAVLDSFAREAERTLALIGINDVRQLGRRHVRSAQNAPRRL